MVPSETEPRWLRKQTARRHRLDIGTPGILCELNYLVDKRFQRLVQFNCLFAQLPQIVRLGKRQIMPQEEPLPLQNLKRISKRAVTGTFARQIQMAGDPGN